MRLAHLDIFMLSRSCLGMVFPELHGTVVAFNEDA